MPEAAAESVSRPAEPGSPPSRMRWALIGFAFLATVLNYVDRQTLSVLAPTLKDEFNISDSQYGLIISSFLLAYTIANGLSGPFVDQVGARIGYAVFVTWWSVAGMLHALARGPWSLGACRFLLGIGEAGNWPAAVKVVSEWFPPHERTLAAGIFNSGAAVGAVVAAPLVAFIALYGGWRQAFLITGAMGFVWVAAWWWLGRGWARVRPIEAAPRVPVRQLVRTRFLRVFTLSKIAMDPVWYFYIFWIPKWLHSEFGFSLADIGKTAWIPFVTADLGNLAGGFVTGRLIRRGISVPVARKAGAALFGLMMTAAIPAIFADTPAQALAWVSVATFGYTGYTANTLAFPAEVYPAGAVGSVWGLASMGSGFGGMFFASLSGWLIERHGYFPVFIGYGVLPLVGLSLVLFALGPLSPLSGLAAAPGDRDSR